MLDTAPTGLHAPHEPRTGLQLEAWLWRSEIAGCKPER